MPRLNWSNHGEKKAWPEHEIDFLECITGKQSNGLTILPSLVRLKALDMAKHEKYGIPPGQFKVGNHWCQRFMKRNGLSLWQKTTLAQQLSSDCEEKIVWFHRYIIDLRKQYSYPLHVIANMDKTPLTFDMLQAETDGNLIKEKLFQRLPKSCNRVHTLFQKQISRSLQGLFQDSKIDINPVTDCPSYIFIFLTRV